MIILTRIIAYSILPLLLATAHMLLDRQARTTARRIEILLIYLFAISLGANGVGGFFGHFFLSDMVAESVGWPAGSPFQLEMAFANLLVGVLGFFAVSRRDGFRSATVMATTIIGFGATIVHLMDIAATGNLAPGNTIQNVGNVLDPLLLIGLMWLSPRVAGDDAESPAFLRWQARQQPIAGMAAAGIGTGFGIGFATSAPLLWTLIGALGGVVVGLVISRRSPRSDARLAPPQ